MNTEYNDYDPGNYILSEEADTEDVLPKELLNIKGIDVFEISLITTNTRTLKEFIVSIVYKKEYNGKKIKAHVSILDSNFKLSSVPIISFAGFGQYYASTLMKEHYTNPRRHKLGLSLYGGDPKFNLGGNNLIDIHNFLLRYLKFSEMFDKNDFDFSAIERKEYKESKKLYELDTGKPII